MFKLFTSKKETYIPSSRVAMALFSKQEKEQAREWMNGLANVTGMKEIKTQTK